MNLDFNGTQPVPVYGLYLWLVVTPALILSFSPKEKGQRLHASLYAVVRRANPVAVLCGSGVQGASLLGKSLPIWDSLICGNLHHLSAITKNPPGMEPGGLGWWEES